MIDIKENDGLSESLESLNDIEWDYIYYLKSEILETDKGEKFDYYFGEDLLLDIVANQYLLNPEISINEIQKVLINLLNSHSLISEVGRSRVKMDLMVCDWCNRGKTV